MLFACTVIVSQGCQEDESDAAPEIVLQSSALEVAPEGGAATMNYTISNPRRDAVIEAGSSAEWLHDFDCSIEGEINFMIDENPELGESRSAKVTVTYADATPREFEVIQSEGVAPFSVEITEIGLDYVTATIEPRDKEMTWLAITYEKWALDERFPTEDDAIADLMNTYSFLAGMYGMDLETFMKSQILSTGTKTMTFDQLSVDTDHYLFAVGLKPDGTRISEAVKVPFRTLSIEKIDVSFDIALEVDGPNLSMKVTPSDKNIRYYTDVKLKSDWKNGPDIQSWIQSLIWRGSISGQTRQEVVDGISSYGDTTKEYYLNADTEYYAFAAAINDDGIICSEEKTVLFTTGEVAMSDNTFDISINETGSTHVDFDIIPSAKNDVYTYAVTPASEWEGMTDEEYVDSYAAANEFFLLMSARSGDARNIKVEGLSPETEYYIFVFGYEQARITTGITKLGFRTSRSGDASNLSFEFRSSDIGSNKVTVTVNPSIQEALYYWDLVPATATEEEARSAVDARVQHYLDIGYRGSRAEVFATKGSRGTIEKSITAYDFGYVNIEPATEYKIFAVGIDETTGEYATGFFFSEPFTTLR